MEHTMTLALCRCLWLLSSELALVFASVSHIGLQHVAGIRSRGIVPSRDG